MQIPQADIPENLIRQISKELLDVLLVNHAIRSGKKRNIFWATHDYESCGSGFCYFDQITPRCISGKNGSVIMPRVVKDRETQVERIRSMAEVFTPSWMCNAQNNLIDEVWFGRSEVFNKEINTPEGGHTWQENTEKITFPTGRTWKDYVCDKRLEITCGEAPYIASRYDTTTGEFIPLQRRIGILDRKLRVVSENTTYSGEWLKGAQAAYKSTYAYEWQGDNLLLAREAMLMSFIEYYQAKFGRLPVLKSMKYIAYIISWNVWQMDGLKGVVPHSCVERETSPDLFGETHFIPCEGCKSGNIALHNGIKCLIKDWSKPKGKQIVSFVDILSPA